MAEKVSVVVPNYNGIDVIRGCLDALREQDRPADRVIVVDNGSSDGSAEVVRGEYPEAELISFPENTGFCGAVNAGIRASEDMDYVILLNNDTVADPGMVGALVRAAGRDPKIFSCQAKMVQMSDPSLIDDAGDLYCAFGWAFARGKGRPAEEYTSPARVFSCCAGAALYRTAILGKTGLFDDNHFAYLEDTDIGWRARIMGYRNVFVPDALVRHIGSASSGSVYNLFKVRNTSRNSIYLIFKNMPLLMTVINLPLLLFGFTVKAVFFAAKGFGKEYILGLGRVFALCGKGRREGKKVRFRAGNLPHYLRIQLEIWVNCIRRVTR